jgi:plasmid maintenance system antidote protein VapI
MLDSRSERINELEKCLKDWEEKGRKQFHRIKLDSLGEIELPLFEIDPKTPYLRPENNRIVPYLVEHGINPNFKTEEFYSSKVQDKIEEILSSKNLSPKFKELKDQLEIHGQEDPCVITYEAELIDGNTRCVAFRQLNKERKQTEEYKLKVAYLKKEYCTPKIINEIEAKFQLRSKIHQDYAFVAQLRYFENLVENHGWDYKQYGRELGLKRESAMRSNFEMNRAFIDYIDEMRKYSGVMDSFFDREKTKETLTELYRAIKGADSENERNQIKYSRYIAILSGGPTKDQIRHIDADFIDDLFENLKKREGDKATDKIIKALNEQTTKNTDDEFSAILDEDNFYPTVDSESLFKSFKSSDYNGENKDSVIPALALELKTSLEDIVNRERRRNMLNSPKEELRAVRESLEATFNDINELSEETGFKIGDVEFEAKKILDAAQEMWINIQTKRGLDKQSFQGALDSALKSFESKIKKHKSKYK